jgi:Nucleosome assembly protein (NAP)
MLPHGANGPVPNCLQISEKDEGVLEHLIDITEEELDPEDGETGFRLTFHFAKNPYFPHETLVCCSPPQNIFPGSLRPAARNSCLVQPLAHDLLCWVWVVQMLLSACQRSSLFPWIGCMLDPVGACCAVLTWAVCEHFLLIATAADEDVPHVGG